MKRFTLPALLALAALGCGDDSDDATEADALAIAGSYSESAGGMVVTNHTITGEVWTQEYLGPMGSTAKYHLTKWDNEHRFAVGHNDPANAFGGGLYSRFDWVNSDGALYYCTSAFDAASAEAAESATAGNPDDLAMGCGGFGWSKLDPQ